MTHSALDESLRRRRAVLREDILLERPRINAYTDREIMNSARVHDSFYPVHIADISGIDAYFVNSGSSSLYRKLVVEMDIRDEWYLHRFLDSGDKLYSLHIRDSCADYLTACLFELYRLLHTPLDIVRASVQHGLYVNMLSVEDAVPDPYRSDISHDTNSFYCISHLRCIYRSACKRYIC